MKLSEMNFEEKKEEKPKDIKVEYDALKDLSQDELMEKLADQIAFQKSNGTFDYDGLVDTINKMKGYISPQSYDNILNLLQKFKWINIQKLLL